MKQADRAPGKPAALATPQVEVAIRNVPGIVAGMSVFSLRPYQPADRDALYEICQRTGNLGEDAQETSSHPRLLGDYFAAPYAIHDPALCLALTDAAGACGYILGTSDTQNFVAWFNRTWLPSIREKYRDLALRNGATDAWLLSLLQEDATVPAWADTHPAHVHIDLLPRAQGQGWGRRMFSAWINLVRARGVPGLHLGVARKNLKAVGFYEHLGLQRLDATESAWWYGLSWEVRSP